MTRHLALLSIVAFSVCAWTSPAPAAEAQTDAPERRLASQAELITLSAARPADENSFEHPTKIVPVTTKLGRFGPKYELPIRPWSIAVMRVAGEREPVPEPAHGTSLQHSFS